MTSKPADPQPGPRVYHPAVEPVEHTAILSDGTWWFGDLNVEDFRRDVDPDAKLYRGVFVPLEEIEQ